MTHSDLDISSKVVIDEVVGIANAIKDNHIDHPSLFAGFSGEILLNSELFKLTKNADYKVYLDYLIDKLLNSFANYPLTSSLSSGITGTALAVTYLAKHRLIQSSQVDELDEIDAHICSFATKSLDIGNWDYLYGSNGALAYLLDHPKCYLYTNAIERCIEGLSALSIKTLCGLKWMIYPFSKELKEKPEYNIGLAHGSLGIISLLLKCYKKNILANECKLLIRQGIDFILSQQLDTNERSCFPSSELDSDSTSLSSPLGWCRGDLTIAIILLDVSRTFYDKELNSFALSLANHTLEDNILKGGYFDACFCHGTSGIAHLYNRIYRQTKDSRFYSQMAYWIRETLKFNSNELKGMSYLSYRNGQYQSDYGLLNGMAGVGLSLLGCIAEYDPEWDYIFLLS